MDERGYRIARPRDRRTSDGDEPAIDFSSGYVLRSIDKFPRQGRGAPWRMYQNYARDILYIRHGAIDDEAMEFSNPPASAERVERAAA
jgi:hypothetical protein